MDLLQCLAVLTSKKHLNYKIMRAAIWKCMLHFHPFKQPYWPLLSVDLNQHTCLTNMPMQWSKTC